MNTKSMTYAASILALSIGSIACAQAQESASLPPSTSGSDGPQLDEIVVTARRTEESLQSVPIAISALSGEALLKQSVLKASDLMVAVPGVFTAPGSNRGSNTPVFAVRGQVARDPSLTNDPSIAIYFAEVPWANPSGSNAAFLDLESVQVLKGPQGTLFGRNTTAGAILVTPKAPTKDFEGYVKAAGGDYGFYSAEGVLNAPLGEDVALRVAGSGQRRDGYMYNVTGDQRMNDVNEGSLRASIKFEPNDRFSTTLTALYSDSDTNGDAQRFLGYSPASPSAGVAGIYARYPAALAQTDSLGRYQQLSSFSDSVASTLIQGVPQVFQTEQKYQASSWSVQNNTIAGLGSSSFFGDLTLKNVIGYREQKDSNTFETVPVPFLVVQTYGDNHANQFSEELQIQGETQRLTYIGGLFYFRQTGADLSHSYSIVPTLAIMDAKVKKTSASAFAHASYALASLDGLSLTAGVRWTHDKQSLVNANRRQSVPGPYSANILDLCPLTSTPTVPKPGSQCGVRFDVSYSEPSWDLGLNYKLTPDSMVYASVSRGYRSGGFSEGAQSPAAASVPFAPEKVYNYEIGSKNDFMIGSMPLRIDVAGYFTDYTDIQRTVNFVGSGGIFNLTINAAKASILGGEIDLTAKPTDNLTATVSYSYVKPEYKTFVDQFRDPVSGIIYPVDVSDSEFILVSRHSVNASLSYAFPVPAAIGEPALSASYYHRTGFYTTSDINTANCDVPGNPNPGVVYTNCYNHAGRLPGYGIANLRLDWRSVFNHGFDLALAVNNVFDKYYYTNALNALGAVGAISAQIGPPRMVSLELTVPFGH